TVVGENDSRPLQIDLDHEAGKKVIADKIAPHLLERLFCYRSALDARFAAEKREPPSRLLVARQALHETALIEEGRGVSQYFDVEADHRRHEAALVFAQFRFLTRDLLANPRQFGVDVYRLSARRHARGP